MWTLKSHRGFTLIETIAALVIISTVLTLAITIVLSVQNASIANQAKIQAIEVANELRDDIQSTFDYASIQSLTLGNELTILSSSCSIDPTLCSLLTSPSIVTDFADDISLIIHTQTSDDLTYQVIRFDIHIVYFRNRFITIGGYLYV